MALMVTYQGVDEKLKDLSNLINRTEAEIDNLERVNRELCTYWNSESAAEYIRGMKEDLFRARFQLLIVRANVKNIRDSICRIDLAERKVAEMMEEVR